MPRRRFQAAINLTWSQQDSESNTCHHVMREARSAHTGSGPTCACNTPASRTIPGRKRSRSHSRPEVATRVHDPPTLRTDSRQRFVFPSKVRMASHRVPPTRRSLGKHTRGQLA